MLGRLKRILRAAIGDLVDRAGDPELELARFVEEVELSLGEVRAERREVSQRYTRLAAKAADERRRAGEWMAKAEAAAERDEDELAKEALSRFHEAETEAESSEERMAEDEGALAELRADEAELELKLDQARREQRRLSARMRRAEAAKRAGGALSAADRESPAGRQFQDRLVETEAEGEAAHAVHDMSVDVQFARLEKGAGPDEELAALKERLKREKQAGSTDTPQE